MLQAPVDGVEMGRLLERVAQPHATPAAMVWAIWAVTKLQDLHPAPSRIQKHWRSAFSHVVDAFVPLLPQATPSHVATMMWACGMAGQYPQHLLQVFAASASATHLQQMAAHEVAQVAWALAELAATGPAAGLLARLLRRMQELLVEQPSAVKSQHLGMMARAVAVLDKQQLAGRLKPLVTAAFSPQRWASKGEELSQWYQVHLWLADTQLLGSAGLGAVPAVTQQQLEQCRAAWEEQLVADSKPSPVQQHVAEVGGPNKHGSCKRAGSCTCTTAMLANLRPTECLHHNHSRCALCVMLTSYFVHCKHVTLLPGCLLHEHRC
jgi:hypothetical protein